MNVIPVCVDCHHWIHHNVAEAVEAGLLVEGRMLRGVYTGPNEDYRREYRGAA